MERVLFGALCSCSKLTLLSCIGAGTVGGVFFAFSTFVMKALAQLPASQGVAVMRQINEVVLNSIFLGVFVGSALLAGGLSVASFLPWAAPRSPLLLAAGILYIVGSFFVTMRLNVPMNERLASLDSEFLTRQSRYKLQPFFRSKAKNVPCP